MDYPPPLYELTNEPYSLRSGGSLTDLNARRICFNTSQLTMIKEEIDTVATDRRVLIENYGYTDEVADRLGWFANRDILLRNLVRDYKQAIRSIIRFERNRLNEIYTRVRYDPNNIS